MISKAGANERPCNTCFTGSGGQLAKSPFFAHYDVNVSLSQYIAVTLSFDFRCPDSKDSRLVCSHTQNIDMLIFQTAKCTFTFNQRYSFTPDQFRNIFMRLSFLKGTFHVYILLKEM